MASVECDDDMSVDSRQSTGTNSDLSDNESFGDTEFDEDPLEDEESASKSRFRRKSDTSDYSEFLSISDEEINSDEDGSEVRSQGMSCSSSETDNDDYDDDDRDNQENGGFDDNNDDDLVEDEHDHRGPSIAEVRERKIGDPRRLHPELWFNEAGEVGIKRIHFLFNEQSLTCIPWSHRGWC